MHPIEQLRYVARASGADARLLVEEAASALQIFGRDPAGMLTGCRRLLTRQPAVGPLWWMCTRLLLSGDSRAESRLLLDEFRADRTSRCLSESLSDDAVVGFAGWPDVIVDSVGRRGGCSALVVDVDGLGPAVVRRLERAEIEAESVDGAKMAGLVAEVDLVLLEAAAAGPAAALVDVGSLALAATARAVGKPTWLVVPLGCYLPELYWQAIVERTAKPALPAFLAANEVIGFGLVDQILRPTGSYATGQTASLAADCAMAPELLVEVR